MNGNMVGFATRYTLAALIVERLRAMRRMLDVQWRRHEIQHLVVDDLFPQRIAQALFHEFPGPEQMTLHRGLEQRIYVKRNFGPQRSLLEEAVRAFQQPEVAQVLSEVVGASRLLPDTQLDASGISLISRGGFLNPHIPQSHDDLRQHYRVLNLVYHVTPDWRLSDGGHLELWHAGPNGHPTTTLAKFNRLIVMATHRASWNSISRVDARRHRCSLFNCYYSPCSLNMGEYGHLDVFRGRPEQKIRDLLLRGERSARLLLRKLRDEDPIRQ